MHVNHIVFNKTCWLSSCSSTQAPLPHPSTTATWLDTLLLNSSSINREVMGSSWLTRAGGGLERCVLSVPERGAPSGLPCFADPVSPKEHAAKVIALEGGRLVLPAALRSNQSGKAKAEVAGSAVRGVYRSFSPTPMAIPSPLPGRDPNGSLGVPAPGCRRLVSARTPAREEGPRGPRSPLTRTLPAADAATALAAPPRVGHVAAGHAVPRSARGADF